MYAQFKRIAIAIRSLNPPQELQCFSFFLSLSLCDYWCAYTYKHIAYLCICMCMWKSCEQRKKRYTRSVKFNPSFSAGVKKKTDKGKNIHTRIHTRAHTQLRSQSKYACMHVCIRLVLNDITRVISYRIIIIITIRKIIIIIITIRTGPGENRQQNRLISCVSGI